MRRALRGVVLAVAVVVPVPSASAKLPGLFHRSQQPPVQSVVYEENVVLSEGQRRLEEMKVELALLSDFATFPYYLSARASGETLELHGFVPNDLVRERARELARRNTFLRVNDALRIQGNLSLRPPLRPASVLKKEATELLQKNLGEPAKQITVDVRVNGVVVVTGSVDSVESKLAVSRLFRQLSGSSGVVNELTPQQIFRDGQQVVRVTRDASMVVPPSALGLAPQIIASQQTLPMPVSPQPMATPLPAPAAVAPTPPASVPHVFVPAPTPEKSPPVPPEKKSSAAAVSSPNLLPPPPPTNSLDARKEELRLPSPVMPKPTTASATPAPYILVPTPTPEKPRQKKSPAPAVSPPLLPSPVLNGPDARKEESRLPFAVPTKRPNTPPKAEPEKTSSTSDTLRAPKLPVKWGHPATSWESQAKKLEPIHAPTPPTSAEQAKMPTPIAPSQLADTKKPHGSEAEGKARTASKKTSLPFAETRVAPTPAMTWRRPGSEEASEPKSQPATKPTEARSSAPAKPNPALKLTESSFASPRRWPPAYAPASAGRPGVIVFDDDPPPPPKPMPAASAMPQPIVPAHLQRQVKSICGWKARDVTVATLPDGILLVTVKVANLSVEDQLTRKILSIPEMTTPKVRLRMDVGP